MSSIANLSAQQLRQAADLQEKIADLENELSQLLGSSAKAIAAPVVGKAPKKKGGMSAAGKAKVAAAQKARWAKINAAKSAVKPAAAPAKAAVVAKPAKKKFVMSAAAKAKISAAAKARWAKVKAEKK
jgi:hypothetical protein